MEGVLVTGEAQADLVGECARCLEEIRDEIVADFQELFVYEESDTAHAEDEDVSRLEGDLLDLEPLLRDSVVLTLPFQPLCQDDCPGLCTECGARLADDPATSTTSRSTPGGRSCKGSRTTPRTTDPHHVGPRERTAPKEYTVAVPKRKMSRSNTRHRRSQWKAVAASLVTCANPACGSKHLPHRACPQCGQYGARADRRQVL